MLPRQQAQELILCAVRILVLIDQHEQEAPTERFEHLWMLSEQFDRLDQQVVKVELIAGFQRFLIFGVDARDSAGERFIGSVLVLLRRNQLILGGGDGTLDHLRLPSLRQLEPFRHPLDQAQAIVLIEDREPRTETEAGRMAPHDSSADGVEGANPDAAGPPPLAEEALNSRAHLLGGLVRKSDGEDAAGIHTIPIDQVGDPGRQHSRLPGPGAGEHQEWSFEMLDRFTLLGVQPLEIVVSRLAHLVPTHASASSFTAAGSSTMNSAP